jgi:ribosomal-protein-alanine N-acetyltransferase
MTPPLHGTISRLVHWNRDHAAALARIANDEDVSRYLLPGFPQPYTIGDATNWISQQEQAPEPSHFAIEEDGVLVGSIGLTWGTGERQGSAFVGYFLGRSFWGRGIATDALRTITAYAFSFPSIYRVWANVMAPNGASGRVLEKAGFLREAALKMAIIDRNGKRHDELIYSTLR